MNSDEIIITDKEKKKKILCRKPINQIMNLEFLKNFSQSANIDSIITLYSSKQLYISPKLKIFQKKKVDNNNNKEAKRKISPNKEKNDLINKNIKNNLYNNKEVPHDNKENKNEKNEIRKYNYKKKININKHKLNKNKENNLILGNLIDNENEGTFDNNSLEKIKIIKFNDYINNKINGNEKNKNKKNNLFDVGSISHISKNGSSSAREKNIEEEIKNNNAFEKIVCDFIEEENCKVLFKKNELNKENIDNNNENNPINQQYKSKALKEIINNENNENYKNNNIKKKVNKKNHEKNKKSNQIATKFIDNIMIDSENDEVIIEKFVNDIFIDAVAINFVKLLFEEILNDFKKKKEKEKKKINELKNQENNIGIINSKKNNKEKYNNIGFMNYKKLTKELNNINTDKIKVNIKSKNNSDSKPLFKSLDGENQKEKNNLMESQENENSDSAYKRISTIPGVSKNFRFGFLRKSSIRREYQQRKYNTLNTDNSEKSK